MVESKISAAVAAVVVVLFVVAGGGGGKRAGGQRMLHQMPASNASPNPSSRKLVCDYPNLWELEEWVELTRQKGGWWEVVEAKQWWRPPHSDVPSPLRCNKDEDGDIVTLSLASY